jgi:hypothetical protein
MRIVHLYTGSDNESHFAEMEVGSRVTHTEGPLAGLTRDVWDLIGVSGGQIQTMPAGQDFGFHTAPRRQLLFLLHGSREYSCSDTETRVFNAGDVILVDDTTGRGHRSIDRGPMQQLLVHVDPELDIESLAGGNPSHL